MLTVKVGKGSKVKNFTVHQSFLTVRSEYFKRAMNGNWEESETRTVTLSHESPEVFMLYLNHIYTGRFPTMTKSKEELDAMERSEAAKFGKYELDQLARVYVLAERLQDVTAFLAVTDAFVHIFNGVAPILSTTAVELVYRETPEGRPSRRLLAHIWSYVPLPAILGIAQWLPREFLDDLSSVVDKQRNLT